MDIRFGSVDLDSLDGLECEALVLPLFEDERPVAGLASLVDWRLCGQLSGLLRAGRIEGRIDEAALVCVRRRLRVPRIFVLGMGQTSRFGQHQFVHGVARMFEVLNQACCRVSAMVLPGRTLDHIPAEQAMTLFMPLAMAQPLPPQGQREIFVFDHKPAIDVMQIVLKNARRRGSSIPPCTSAL